MVTVETKRLILRMLRESDLDAYAQMCGDVEVMRYLSDGKPFTRGESWRSMAVMIGHWQLRGYGMWAVEEKASGTMVGRVGPWYPEGWPGKEVGWTLRREYWGRGYATEAAEAAIAYAFSTLGWPEVISLIRPANAPSIRVAQRVGEELTRTIELLGSDTLVYRVTREQWESKRQQGAAV